MLPLDATKTKGFGGSSVAKTDAPKVKAFPPWKVVEPRDKVLEDAVTSMDSSHATDATNNLLHYLNPKHTEASALDAISRDLQQGKCVVLRDALDPTLAEITHRDLRAESAPWELNENYFEDGYAFKHSNIFKRAGWTARMNKTMGIFESKETKEWLSKLTGRDCSGETTGAPSYYTSGDHSLPHTDWAGQRTVSYVWHLSKDWQPEWGGGLYWCANEHSKAYHHASFNTLVLFGVTTRSSHFVTTGISLHAYMHIFMCAHYTHIKTHMDTHKHTSHHITSHTQ
jgi:2OG-Fe(II) oxygenase superfamily